MRETSRRAYWRLLARGVIRGQLARVARAVAEHGPGTSAEVCVVAELDANRNLTRARFSELVARGVLAIRDVRECHVTGRHAVVFEFAPTFDRPASRRRHRAAWRELAIDAVDALGGTDAKLAARRDELLASEPAVIDEPSASIASPRARARARR